MVANYAYLLSAAGQESGLASAKAISDTTPDSGGRLPAMVTTLRSTHSPALAQQVMGETVADLPVASSEKVTYLELTFRGCASNRKNDQYAILAELARKTTGLVATAQSAGGGHIEMVKAPELIRLVRESYDPVTSQALEAAELDGDAEPLEWSSSGCLGIQRRVASVR